MANKWERSHGYTSLDQAWPYLNEYLQTAINEERLSRMNCNELGPEHKHCRCIACIELRSIRMIDEYRNTYYNKKTIPDNFPCYKDTNCMRENIYRTHRNHDPSNRFGNYRNTSNNSPYASMGAVGTIPWNNFRNTGRFGR